MKNALTRIGAAAAICGATLVAAPEQAHAYDVNGIGLGADVSLGNISGLALSVGLGRFELDFIVGMTIRAPDGGVVEPDFGGAVGFFYTLTDIETTNFQLGGRVGTIIDSNEAGGSLVTHAGVTLEALMRIEHRLDEHFQLNFQAGVATAIWPDGPRDDFQMGIGGTGLVGSAGFRYFFDALGGGSSSASAPSDSRRASSGGSSGGSSSGGSSGSGSSGSGSSGGSAETPYWEQ